MLHFLAQTFTYPQTGGEADAFEIVSSSIDLARSTSEAWNGLWINILQPLDSGLWIGLVRLGLTLAAGSIVFLTLTSGREIVEKQSWSELMAMFVWPVVITLFLGGNGNLLSQTVTFARNFGYQQVQKVLQAQLGELTFKNAIAKVTISNIAKQQIENVYSECRGKVGQELIECWESKQAQVQQIVKRAEEQSKGPLEPLRQFADFLVDRSVIGTARDAVRLTTDPGGVFRETAIPIIRFILYSLQWAFVNILEAALLLTALFSPIAMGMSLLPLQGRPIWAWTTGFLSLFGIQLGYNIIVGLAAVVLVNSGAELASDVAFLFFLSIFAPILAVLIAGGGGIALYNGISSNIKQLIDVFSNAIGSFTTLVVKSEQ